MTRKHTYHRERCTSCVRMKTKDTLGRDLILTGTHAFEWSISIISKDSIVKMEFRNRTEATKEFNKYRKR